MEKENDIPIIREPRLVEELCGIHVLNIACGLDHSLVLCPGLGYSLAICSLMNQTVLMWELQTLLPGVEPEFSAWKTRARDKYDNGTNGDTHFRASIIFRSSNRTSLTTPTDQSLFQAPSYEKENPLNFKTEFQH